MLNKTTRYWARQYKIRKLKAIEYKGGKCQKCSYDRCPAALEFHHRDPSEKDFEWYKLQKQPWDRVLLELDKCDMLCANCHRETHHNQQLWDAIIEWRNALDKSKICPIICDTCKNVFKPSQHGVFYCSVKCAAKRVEKIVWPSDLPQLVAQTSKSAVAKQLGVSDKAVAKRLKNHHALT